MVIRSVKKKPVRVGVNFKIEPEHKKRLEEIAEEERDTLSNFMRKIVLDLIDERDGRKATKRRS